MFIFNKKKQNPNLEISGLGFVFFYLNFMFTTKIIHLTNTIHQYQIYQNDERLTYKQVIELWQTNSDFCQFYNNILAKSPFNAYFWENPPINNTTIHQPYEFVLVNSSALSRIQATRQAFLKYFDANKGVVHFENLGKDALLIVPSPLSDNSDFPHLAAFVRNASNAQLQLFWQQIGEQVAKRLSEKWLWVSTSGLGVYWLHVRLDDRPKYYQHRPYQLK